MLQEGEVIRRQQGLSHSDYCLSVHDHDAFDLLNDVNGDLIMVNAWLRDEGDGFCRFLAKYYTKNIE